MCESRHGSGRRSSQLQPGSCIATQRKNLSGPHYQGSALPLPSSPPEVPLLDQTHWEACRNWGGIWGVGALPSLRRPSVSTEVTPREPHSVLPENSQAFGQYRYSPDMKNRAKPQLPRSFPREAWSLVQNCVQVKGGGSGLPSSPRGHALKSR